MADEERPPETEASETPGADNDGFRDGAPDASRNAASSDDAAPESVESELAAAADSASSIAGEAAAAAGAKDEAPAPSDATPPDDAADGPKPDAVDLPALTPAQTAALPGGMALLTDVDLDVRVELGRTRMLVEDVLRLSEGAVVELEKLAGDPVDIYVNGRHVARGEVLVLNDNFCVRVSEILQAIEQGAATKTAG